MTGWQTNLFALTRSPRAMQAWRIALGMLSVGVGWLALTPNPPPAADLGWDKLNHACAFAALAVAAYFGLRSARARPAALGSLLAYGGLIEIAQTFVPGRSGEWADLLADAAGIAIGALLAGAVTAAAERGISPRRVRSSGPRGSG